MTSQLNKQSGFAPVSKFLSGPNAKNAGGQPNFLEEAGISKQDLDTYNIFKSDKTGSPSDATYYKGTGEQPTKGSKWATKNNANSKRGFFELIVPTPPGKGASPTEMSNYWLDAAIFMAQIGWNQGGVPIGSSLADADGTLVSMGHNNRHQWDDPTAHGEIDNMRNAGNRTDWKCCTLASTLSCCSMCSGMIVLYKIPNVIAGEDKTFQGPTKWLQENGVNVNILQSGKQHNMCVKMMKLLQSEDLELWNRDIGVTTCKNKDDCTNANTYAFPDTATCSNGICGCTSAKVPQPSNPARRAADVAAAARVPGGAETTTGNSDGKISIALLSAALLGLILLIILRLKH